MTSHSQRPSEEAEQINNLEILEPSYSKCARVLFHAGVVDPYEHRENSTGVCLLATGVSTFLGEESVFELRNRV